MVIKTRLLWVGWGPNWVDMCGWSLVALWRPRQDETPLGERIKADWRLEIRRGGPSLIYRRHHREDVVRSEDWTGLDFYWPPRFSLERG